MQNESNFKTRINAVEHFGTQGVDTIVSAVILEHYRARYAAS